MTRVVISQPMYFPWPGFLAQMALADVYIWLDDAQFSKGSFTNRVQVKVGAERKWMSVPLAGKGSGQFIGSLSANGNTWEQGHRALLTQSLRGKPYVADALALFDSVMAGTTLCDRMIESAQAMAKPLGILPKRILRSSNMGVEGTGWSRVLDMVRAVDGTTYITGHGAASYLDHAAFEAADIAVEYMSYDVAPWPQTGEFTPYVTALDLLASCTPTVARTGLNPATVSWRSFLKERSGS
ncbi:WbqC-like protein family protein [Monaibacterium marinum]|uniref:WbqC-like protein family protein n=1 Tax=Pontivivens marinum TaxID=1690039 RepID=A0A2C9CW68_9RHOB|nr:WbqC family protein [Monaibacterium marinum]SOH95596.1 WbqC-like protein family protein [Monaibacterium marinum]